MIVLSELFACDGDGSIVYVEGHDVSRRELVGAVLSSADRGGLETLLDLSAREILISSRFRRGYWRDHVDEAGGEFCEPGVTKACGPEAEGARAITWLEIGAADMGPAEG